MDASGNTPLHCVCFGEGGGDGSSSGTGAEEEEEVTRILLRASPDAAWMENKTGWTSLDSLIKCNHNLIGTALRLTSTNADANAMWEPPPPCTMPASTSSPPPSPGNDDDDPAIAERLRSFWWRAALLIRAAYDGPTPTPAAETGPLEQVVHTAVAGVEDGRHVPADAIMFAFRYPPGQLGERDRAGRLPVHIACANRHINGRRCRKVHGVEQQDGADQVANVDLLMELVASCRKVAGVHDGGGRMPLHLALKSGKVWGGGVDSLVNEAEYVITVKDGATSLYRFVIASVCDLTTVYCLLRCCPEFERFAL